MFLFIDTSVVGYVRAGLVEQGSLASKQSEEIGVHYSEQILKVVDSVLSERPTLEAIFVVSGPGRFSALRTGVTVANTLAWANKIPVVGIKALRQAQDDKPNRVIKYWEQVEKMISQEAGNLVSIERFGSFVVPAYGQELNITIKKQ
jgi:tRNA A37 threonylcarbamoyladenosine modification protein TsaB